MLLTNSAGGVFAIMPTPFHSDGRIDYLSLDRLIDFYAECGVDGLTVLGQLGEAPKLREDEAMAIVRRVTKRAACPVVVGVSAPGFESMRALAAGSMELGASGVMIAPATSLRTDDQIVNYYRQCVDAIGPATPFVVQDYPLSFSVVMSTNVIRRIASESPGFVMLKHEDWPGLEKISTLRSLEESGDIPHLSILCGNGGLFLDFEVARGADGAMTGYCFPEMLVETVAHARAGRIDESHEIFDAHLPLMRYEQQPGLGLAVRKYVLRRRGLLADDAQRAPGITLTDTTRREVDYLLDRLAQRDPRAMESFARA